MSTQDSLRTPPGRSLKPGFKAGKLLPWAYILPPQSTPYGHSHPGNCLGLFRTGVLKTTQNCNARKTSMYIRRTGVSHDYVGLQSFQNMVMPKVMLIVVPVTVRLYKWRVCMQENHGHLGFSSSFKPEAIGISPPHNPRMRIYRFFQDPTQPWHM